MQKPLALILALLASAAIASADPAGLFVAVGYGGRRLSSLDGQTWTSDQRWSDIVADDDNVLFNIAYGLNRFLAVGGGAKIGHILSTTDGQTWTELPQWKGRVATIVFAEGGVHRFIAGHDAELLWSDDGVTFHSGKKLPYEGSVHARMSACGDTEAGYMTAILGDVDLWSEKKRVSWRASTTDGETWAAEALNTPEVHGLAYGAGRFIVVGPHGLIETSHDGQSWSRVPVTTEENFSSVVWTNGEFIARGDKRWTSPDGLAWEADSQKLPGDLVFARDAIGGVSVSWGGNLFFSADLLAWKKAAIAAGPSLTAAAWGSAAK